MTEHTKQGSYQTMYRVIYHDFWILFHHEHSHIYQGYHSSLHKDYSSMKVAQSNGIHPSHDSVNTYQACKMCLIINSYNISHHQCDNTYIKFFPEFEM